MEYLLSFNLWYTPELDALYKKKQQQQKIEQ